MNFKSSLNNVNSVLLTAVITSVLLIVFYFSLPDIEKFKAKIISTSSSYVPEAMVYYDIDDDGNSEGFHFLTNPFNGLSHYIFYKNGKSLYQHNPQGSFFGPNYFYFGDYDHDKQMEIYLFFYREDSLFLNVIEAVSEELIAKKVFVTTFTLDNETIDTNLDHFYFFDTDKDGFDELFFSMSCGFSVTNRKNILYNVKKNNLNVSDPRGVFINPPAVFMDVTGDSIPEIFGKRASHGNTKTNYYLTDQKLWYYLADIQHRFIFPPKAIGDYPGMVATTPLFIKKKPMIAVLMVDYGENYDSTSIAICNLKGDVINKINLHYSYALQNVLFTSFPENNPENIRILLMDGTLMEFNSVLEKTKSGQSSPFYNFFECTDIDGDRNNEYLFLGNQNNLVITDSNFGNPVSINLDNIENLKEISILKQKGKNNLLSVVTQKMRYLIDYRKNPFYTFRFAIYLFIWFILFVLIYITGRFYQKLAVKKYESEKKLTELQISAMENQLTPHFNLNILNSIGALYETHETSKAQYYMGKYSKLLRNLLMRSDKISVSIEEELDFTKDYLELEKLRMNDKFEYCFEGESGFPEIEIPKMLIHTFCENAIKHGIRHSNKKGKLEIRFFRGEKQLKIIISDNGIGREKARQYSSMSTGKGLEIINQTLELYFQLKQIRIKYNISDIYDGQQNVAGTRVEITIPLN